MIEFYRLVWIESTVSEMKCFMMPGWLMCSEMCRPSLYVWWGNILFLSHIAGNFMTLLSLSTQHFRATCSDLSDLLYQPSTPLPATTHYCLENMPYKFLNQSRTQPVTLLALSQTTKCHVSPLLSQLWNLTLAAVFLFDWQTSERYDSIKKCSLTAWFDSPLQTKYTLCSWHYINLTRRKVVKKKRLEKKDVDIFTLI